MPTTTWELHYGVPRYPADQHFMLGYLEHLKDCYTGLVIDYDKDDKGVHVMVSDIRTFKAVFVGLVSYGPCRMSVSMIGEVDFPNTSCGVVTDQIKTEMQMTAIMDDSKGDEESSLLVGNRRSLK
jgi:hypothetical protein